MAGVNGMRHGSPAKRFWTKVEKTQSCWEWQASKTRDGYGNFSIGDHRMVLAHRFSYETLVGPVPDGLDLDHLCRNRACVNPTHLEPVTRAENVYRGIAPAAINKRKTYCIRGHPLSGENLRFTRAGKRVCRECRNMRARKSNSKYYYAKKNRHIDIVAKEKESEIA
jgi:hypothetical protein